MPRVPIHQLDLPTFGEHFLDHHAGSIIADPRHALVELVANAWDAGATRVDITWPASVGDELRVADNGTGMTVAEFRERWRTLSYNRLAKQGSLVEFPPGVGKRHRVAFGRNGVGRHAMFCFSPKYVVTSSKDGERLTVAVARAGGDGRSPFTFGAIERTKAPNEHGTALFAEVAAGLLPLDEVRSLVGSRFVADPGFRIFVNGLEITLTHLEERCEVTRLPVPEVGELVVRRYDNLTTGRTSRQCGVAWWVNRRLVGTPSWDVVDGPLLDARGMVGKRFTYVIEADVLAGTREEPTIRPDWSGFFASGPVTAAKRAVDEFVRSDLRSLLADLRKERKREALANNKQAIRQLPTLAQEHVARFAEEILVQSPTISERDLGNAVQVLATLEKSRTGYSLLEKLAQLSPDDMEGLDAILDEWTVSDARKVLDELRYRLRLIQQLEELVEKHTTDELHDLQPLFERGLWIFGPEFEAVSFTSNRTLATVLEKLFEGAATPLQTPRRRPDFVIVPNGSLGVYTADAFDEQHEVSGLARVVVVELKRGGFHVTSEEMDQALDYARELRKGGRVSKQTPILCYVLGSTIDPAADEEMGSGQNTRILARRYDAVLKQAHARTFRLLQRIQGSKALQGGDQDLADVMDQGELEFTSGTVADTVDVANVGS